MPGERMSPRTWPLALAAPWSAIACGRVVSSDAARLFLLERGPSQAFYGADSRLEPLLDRDGDRRADTQTLKGADGKPVVAEIDTDFDGIVDRWELFGPDGGVERLGLSRRAKGRRDLWVALDASGAVRRRELDDDGDGRIDHAEVISEGRVAVETYRSETGAWVGLSPRP